MMRLPLTRAHVCCLLRAYSASQFVFNSLLLNFYVCAASEQIFTRAKGIESTVLSEFGNVSAQYKSKIRSLYVNLKDKNNPGLRESVVSGDLPVARLCKMTSQEMASEERKAADSKIRAENLFKTLGAEEVQAGRPKGGDHEREHSKLVFGDYQLLSFCLIRS